MRRQLTVPRLLSLALMVLLVACTTAPGSEAPGQATQPTAGGAASTGAPSGGPAGPVPSSALPSGTPAGSAPLPSASAAVPTTPRPSTSTPRPAPSRPTRPTSGTTARTITARPTTSTTARSAPPTARPTTAPATSTGSPTAGQAACAATVLAGLSRSQRIGQLLMVAVPADELSAWRSVLGTQAVGGIFLAGRSSASADDLATALSGIQAAAGRTAGVKLHLAVDQEGGYVQSLRGPDFPAIGSAVQQGEESSGSLRSNTREWAAALARAGITLDLAPVADTVPPGTASENPPIGAQDRQYGSSPDAVAESVSTVVTAMLDAGVGSTVKHFPGLGRVSANTDTSADVVDTETTAADPYLQPFRAGIAAGTTAVMISSARYPALDPDSLAVFSRPIITGLLRGRLGFTGLVVSDDLGNAVAVDGVPAGRRAVDFVAAGGDLALTVRPADLALMADALTDEAAVDPQFRARIDDAALHVLASKASLGMLRCR